MATESLPVPFLVTVVVVTGLLVGSFLNVVIYRLPVQLQRDWQRDARSYLGLDESARPAGRFNLLVPASRCPGCETPLRPWHNIPVLSYLALKGRCGHCSVRIPAQYPLVEIASAVLSVAVISQFGWTPTAALLLVFTWALLALAVIDWNTQLLPDVITLPLLWLGLLANTQALLVPLADAVIGAAAGYLLLWCIYWLFRLVTGKEGMGYGDFKLLAALGAWLGWQMLPLIIILASFAGAIIGLAGMILQRRDRQLTIAFGPYLAIAGWIALIWGQDIVAAYLGQL